MMKFSAIFVAAWFLLSTLRTVSPQNIGEGDTEDSNIVGGTISDPVPGYVAVGPGRCGGQLIHPDVVLTAAHCNTAFTVNSPVFISGTSQNDPGKSNAVAQFVEHEDYDVEESATNGLVTNLQNDIAVFRLIMESQEPVSVWSTSIVKPSVNDRVRIVGFGITAWGQTSSGVDKLQETTLTVLDNGQCRSNAFTFLKDDQMACASNTNSSPCSGDSGSPFFDTNTDTTNENMTIVGILSFSANRCPKGGPIVMTRVSHYDQWINKQICLISQYPPPSCSIPTVCGDNICTPNKENATTCPEDCPIVEPPPCANFICSFFGAIAAGFGAVVSTFYFCF